MRFLRITLCALIMAGVSFIDLGASLDNGSVMTQVASAKRRHKRKRHRKHARKHRKHHRKHAKASRSRGPEL